VTTTPRRPCPNHRENRDARGYWRVLFVVVAPLPMLAQGVFYIGSPASGDATYADTVTAFSAHQGLLELMKAMAILLGGATHPFIPGSLGQGVGLLIAAAGFVGVRMALLRMTNVESDLPPRPPEPDGSAQAESQARCR
jgi:hypothetical protein